jgi:hypothetical protein
MRGAQIGLGHIEHSFAASGTLEVLRVWPAASRGMVELSTMITAAGDIAILRFSFAKSGSMSDMEI